MEQLLGNFNFQLLAKGRTWIPMDNVAKHRCSSRGSQICSQGTEPPRAATLSPDSTKLLSCCKVSLNWFLHPALLANFLLCHQRPDLIWQECALVWAWGVSHQSSGVRGYFGVRSSSIATTEIHGTNSLC